MVRWEFRVDQKRTEGSSSHQRSRIQMTTRFEHCRQWQPWLRQARATQARRAGRQAGSSDMTASAPRARDSHKLSECAKVLQKRVPSSSRVESIKILVVHTIRCRAKAQVLSPSGTCACRAAPVVTIPCTDRGGRARVFVCTACPCPAVAPGPIDGVVPWWRTWPASRLHNGTCLPGYARNPSHNSNGPTTLGHATAGSGSEELPSGSTPCLPSQIERKDRAGRRPRTMGKNMNKRRTFWWVIPIWIWTGRATYRGVHYIGVSK